MRFDETAKHCGYMIKPCPADLEQKIEHIERGYLGPYLKSRGFVAGPHWIFRRRFATHVWIVQAVRLYPASTKAEGPKGLTPRVEIELGVYHPSWVDGINEIIFFPLTRSPQAFSCFAYTRLDQLVGADRCSWGKLGRASSADKIGKQVLSEMSRYGFKWFKANSSLPDLVERVASRVKGKAGLWESKVYAMRGYALIGNTPSAKALYRAAIEDPPIWPPERAERQRRVKRLTEWAVEHGIAQ